ncbi:MAG: hypothetical protein QOH71_3700 [Blastocatellia bacterium]|jgi:hypothetical protein|nr:hypothetical protein [Blastocatellia bacterium]
METKTSHNVETSAWIERATSPRSGRQNGSPGRKPGVYATIYDGRAPKGRKKVFQKHFQQEACRPLRGLAMYSETDPRAYARGYNLLPSSMAR